MRSQKPLIETALWVDDLHLFEKGGGAQTNGTIYGFFFKQKTAYEIVSGDWSSDVCSSDLPNRQTWLEQRRREAEELGHVTQPYAVVVGGGQGGMVLGARLGQLAVR